MGKMIRQLPPTADMMADILGLQVGMRPGRGPLAKRDILSFCRAMGMADLMQRRETEMTFESQSLGASFASQYGPALVDFLLRFPLSLEAGSFSTEGYSTYLHIFCVLVTKRYFVKYLLSERPSAANGNDLASYFAAQLVTHGKELQTVIERQMENAQKARLAIDSLVQILLVIVSVQVDKTIAKPLPRTLRLRLLNILDTWAPSLTGKRRNYLDIAGILRRDERAMTSGRFRRAKLECLNTCAARGCEAQYDLLQCARCKTVLYCFLSALVSINWITGKIASFHTAWCATKQASKYGDEAIDIRS